jgi:aspartate aminotransferase
MVQIAGAKPVILEAFIEDDFKIDPRQLAKSITKETRLLIINNPSNPTGSCYSKKELQALGKILANFPDVTVVADEIYEHIYWGDSSFCSFSEACPQLYDQIITVNGVSKAYAMTGWRIGYAAGPKHLIAAMKAIQSQSTSNPCSISQIAALAALQGNQSVVRNMTKQYKKRHDYIFSAINEIKGFECRKGAGSFYIFPRIIGALQKKNLKSDTELVELLIQEANVACVPGSAFGAPGYIRLSYACSLETLREAVKRIKQVIMS